MKKILDSGNRREFESGAVRDISEGKGRCDLLPLNIVDEWICFNAAYGGTNDYTPVLRYIYEYIRYGNRSSLIYALNAFCHDRNWKMCDAILEVSKHYEEGAKNTQKETGRKAYLFIVSLIAPFDIILSGYETMKMNHMIELLCGTFWVLFGLLLSMKIL